MSSSRNAAYEARASADNALEAAQTHRRETNVERGAVIKPGCDKGVHKSSRIAMTDDCDEEVPRALRLGCSSPAMLLGSGTLKRNRRLGSVSEHWNPPLGL